jgi:signal recognition particle receptor subunit beta
MHIIKIGLFGPSGAGKTETLLCLDPNAILSGEQKRKPTSDETEAWGSDLDVSTSHFLNVGHCIVEQDYTNDHFKLVTPNKKAAPDAYHVTIYDSCGQDIFRTFREMAAEGAWGILFIIDASRDFNLYKFEVTNAFNELHSLYNDHNTYGPISTRNPKLPPLVVLCNKQDIVQRRRILDGGIGRETFYKTILRSYDPIFDTYPFIGTSATGYQKWVSNGVVEVVPTWGIEEAIDLLFKQIAYRLALSSDQEPEVIPLGK